MDLISVLLGLAGGGTGVFVLQNVVLKNKKEQLIREVNWKGKILKRIKFFKPKKNSSS